MTISGSSRTSEPEHGCWRLAAARAEIFCRYRGYLRIFKEDPAKIDELLSIKRSKMTPEKFERLCRETGFQIVERKLWLISPHYKAKFHLRPTRLRLGLDHIPFLRNFLSTSCFYIVSAM